MVSFLWDAFIAKYYKEEAVHTAEKSQRPAGEIPFSLIDHQLQFGRTPSFLIRTSDPKFKTLFRIITKNYTWHVDVG